MPTEPPPIPESPSTRPPPTSGLSRLLGPVLGLVAGAVFLVLAFHEVSFRDVADRLARGHWGLSLPAILLGVAAFIVAKARRWRALLGDPAGIGTLALVRPVAVGLLFNAVIAHSGEFARAMDLNRRFRLPTSGVLAGIAVERLFDFIVVLVFGLFAGALTALPASLVPALRVLGVISAGLGSGVALALVAPDTLRALVGRVGRLLPARLGRFLDAQVGHALEGLSPLRAAHGVPNALFWSVIQWSAIVWCIAFCARVTGIALTPPMAALVLIGIVVVFTLPSAPGYLGSTQVAFLAVLVPLGIAKDPALAASFVYTVAVVVPLMLSGVLALVFPAASPQRDGR